MRNKIGTFCMIIGALLVFGALGLLVYNQWEAREAQKAATELLPLIITDIENKKQEQSRSDMAEDALSNSNMPQIWQDFMAPVSTEMVETEIDGYKYIGYLSIPALKLELPIMADWSYPKLKIAPCRYAGTVGDNNLVLMAHNYAYHFGGLKDLTEGDNVFFTDMEGNITMYEVVARDVLNPVAVEEVTAGNYDLTLFTCTYGGQSRVTVYCDRAQGN